jgi:hypothetical protein
MSAPIRRNDAVTFAQKEKHLRVPIIRRERPAVTEDDGLPAAPVFIINVDVSSVFFSDSYVWHDDFPFGLSCTRDLPPVAESVPSHIPSNPPLRHVKFL